jgi:DNA helicase HerA-like ATPase
MTEYGTVISTFDGPCTKKFSFVIKKDGIVRKGQFIEVAVEGGRLIGRVADVFKTNRYFQRPESVERYESSKPMEDIFPVGNWEYLVAEAAPLGVYGSEGRFEEVSFPPSPGTKVREPDHAVLSRFIGLDDKGLEIGELPYHDLKVRLNLTRLLQKHLAILAISGAGKSYLVSVILEELLNRRKEDGQLATIIIDTHGEYVSFANDPAYADKVSVYRGEDIKIGLPGLSANQIAEFLPNLSPVQAREFARLLRGMKTGRKNFGPDELLKAIEEDERLKSSTRDVLGSVICELTETGIFGALDSPDTKSITQQGKLSIIDLSSFVSASRKQMVVSHLARNLFNLRREEKIPPFLLILEEAHQFVPETAKAERAVSRGIIQTIAREGRKFHASLCLISQRPVQLSTTVLSQCNTHIILRVTNPYDLDHIGESSEGITKDVLGQISGLRVGTGLIVGEAVNYPVFVRIRSRRSKASPKGMPLEEAAKEFSNRERKKKEDAKSFM